MYVDTFRLLPVDKVTPDRQLEVVDGRFLQPTSRLQTLLSLLGLLSQEFVFIFLLIHLFSVPKLLNSLGLKYIKLTKFMFGMIMVRNR